MIISNKNNVGVSAEFDSGTFMHFSVVSTKHPRSFSLADSNIQSVENLSFEDFTLLEIMIGQTVSYFLDMKKREKVLTETMIFTEVKMLIDEYYEIFEDICGSLGFTTSVDAQNFSEDECELIIKTLKREHREIWKELR